MDTHAPRPQRPLLPLSLLLLSTLALSACGAGGGGADGGAQAPPPLEADGLWDTLRWEQGVWS